jgi:hypothetical protein
VVLLVDPLPSLSQRSCRGQKVAAYVRKVSGVHEGFWHINNSLICYGDRPYRSPPLCGSDISQKVIELIDDLQLQYVGPVFGHVQVE